MFLQNCTHLLLSLFSTSSFLTLFLGIDTAHPKQQRWQRIHEMFPHSPVRVWRESRPLNNPQLRSQIAERVGNRATNQKVAGLIPGRVMKLCPWTTHFTLLTTGECPCTYCKSLWIRCLSVHWPLDGAVAPVKTQDTSLGPLYLWIHDYVFNNILYKMCNFTFWWVSRNKNHMNIF